MRQPRLSVHSVGPDSSEASDYHSCKDFFSQAKRPENCRCSVQEGTANKDLAGSPTKICLRTQQHGALERIVRGFRSSQYRGGLDNIATSRGVGRGGRTAEQKVHNFRIFIKLPIYPIAVWTAIASLNSFATYPFHPGTGDQIEVTLDGLV